MELWNVRLRYRGRHPMEMMWEHECRSCTLYLVPCICLLRITYAQMIKQKINMGRDVVVSVESFGYCNDEERGKIRKCIMNFRIG